MAKRALVPPTSATNTLDPEGCMEKIVSSIAATLTKAAFVPQAYKIIRSRETAGVSLLLV